MIVRFDRDCVTARLEGRVPAQVLEAVDAALTYMAPNIYFSPAYKLGHDDGKRRLFDLKRQEFPPGLESRVFPVLDMHMQNGYTIEDDRPLNKYDPEAIHTLTLEGVALYVEQKHALHAFFENEARGCMELPTNFGKTEIMAGVLKLTRPRRALVLMDSKSLMAQTATRLAYRLKERVGKLGGGYKERDTRIVVATVQSIWHSFAKMRKDFLPAFEVLVVDECHKISPKMWLKILGEITAPIRLGLSATIREASRRMVVESYIGPVVHETSALSMIEAGRAAKPTIKMLRIGGIVSATDPQVIYEDGIVRNVQRNRLICEAIKRAVINGEAPLTLIVRIEHGDAIQQMLEDDGLYIPFLHGKTALDIIVNAKKKFGTSSVPGIIASTIFDFGQDMPEIRVAILAGAQRSPLRTIQRVGRSLRNKTSGDNTVRVMDFYDMSHRMLQNQADERRRTYKRKFGNVTLVSSIDEIFQNPTRPIRQPVA